MGQTEDFLKMWAESNRIKVQLDNNPYPTLDMSLRPSPADATMKFDVVDAFFPDEEFKYKSLDDKMADLYDKGILTETDMIEYKLNRLDV